MRAAREEDPAAKAELFRRHADGVAAVIYRMLGADTELDDLLQDTFEDAFRKLDRLHRPEAFKAWLRTIAVGKTVNFLRRRRLQTRLGLRRAEPLSLEELVAKEAPPDVAAELRAVYRALERLPVAQRVVLVLRRVEGHTVREIVELTGWSRSTVNRNLDRALAALRRERGEGA